MKSFYIAAPLALLASTIATPASAQTVSPTDIRACTGIESDSQRLACYDHSTGRENLPSAQKTADKPSTSGSTSIFGRDKATAAVPSDAEPGKPLSLLDSRWELSPESKLGTFNVRGYKPLYLMPAFVTSNQNTQPHSPNPVNSVATPQELDNVEAKFQLSLKTKAWQGVFGDYGDLWLGYTQDSHWQIYNKDQSRPFRETNYEPEAMLVFNTNYSIFGWDGRMLGIGVNHQSNGRSDPLSRSWNRVMADIGFERDNWTVMFRPWWRIPESRGNDNNPDISNYMGRGDMQIIHEWNGQEFGLMLRSSFRGGSDAHGAAQFTWSFPLVGNLHGYMEAFKGYGESLIDYNHNATYVGAGISLLNWY